METLILLEVNVTCGEVMGVMLTCGSPCSCVRFLSLATDLTDSMSLWSLKCEPDPSTITASLNWPFTFTSSLFCWSTDAVKLWNFEFSSVFSSILSLSDWDAVGPWAIASFNKKWSIDN